MKEITIYQVNGYPATARIDELITHLTKAGILSADSFEDWLATEIDIKEYLTEYAHYRGDEILAMLAEQWKQATIADITANADYYGIAIVTIAIGDNDTVVEDIISASTKTV